MLTESVSGKFDINEFSAFLEFRPKGERWDLIDGVAVLMQQPTLAHRRIGANFIFLLNLKLAAGAVEAFAYQEVAAMDNFLPRPDVVVGPGFAGYEYYSDYFLLVAEILSPTNTWREIGLKLQRYFAAPHCLYALVIDPKNIGIEMFARTRAW